MARQRLRAGRRGTRRTAGLLLAVSVCLALGLSMGAPGSALAISGYATPGPAVNAQYPGLNEQQGPSAGVTLGQLVQATTAAKQDPKLAAHWRAANRSIARKARAALASAARLAAPETGSIGLLVAGIAALSIGGVLRWRRGHTQT